MRKIFYILIAALTFYCCTESTGELDSDKGSIYGIVTNNSTAEPMRATGVELYIKADDTSYSLLTRTVTYDDGHYEFKNLNTGHYRLEVTAEGYNKVTYNVIVESNRTAQGDMQLEKINTYMTVRTLEISQIKGNTAIFKGFCSIQFNYPPKEYGFLYATHPNPVNGGKKVTASSDFVVKITDLSKATYYVQAYAKNSLGTEYGEERTFHIYGVPSVITLPVTNITATSSTLNGKIEYKGDPNYSERGFVYSNTFQNPTIEDNKNDTKKVIVTGIDADFSANVSELKTGATYYARAYAKNEAGITYGESAIFKPIDISMYVLILESDGIMVQKNDISSGANWTSANDLCTKSNLAEFKDWRLPTIGELNVLYTKRFTIGGFVNNVYWSGSALSHNMVSGYWELDFTDGGDGGYNGHMKTRSYRVRCVRSLP